MANKVLAAAERVLAGKGADGLPPASTADARLLAKFAQDVAWSLDRFEKQNGAAVAKAAGELREILGLGGR